MNTLTRLRKIEGKIGKRQEVQSLCVPIVELTPEEKLIWPKNLPYPIMGELSNQWTSRQGSEKLKLRFLIDKRIRRW